jgi:aspartate kinase
MRVLKFGAAAFADVEQIQQTVAIIRDMHREVHALAVVCSALPGITDALLRAARASTHGGEIETDYARRELWNRHRQIAERYVSDAWEREMLYQKLSELLKQLDRTSRAMNTLGEHSPRGSDAIASLGERFAAHVLAVILRQNGVAAQMIDATELIITDERFGSARPFVDDSVVRICDRILPMLTAGIVPVITGYTGATRSGAITTLGRGGGDYTASLVAAAVNATEVFLWTDVNGVLTADPKIISTATSLPVLSYREAAELATLSGSEILHLRALMPLATKQIPLRIVNVRAPELPGTLITAHTSQLGSWGSIISTRNLAMVSATASSLPAVYDTWTPELAADVTRALAQAGIEILMAHQSELDRTLIVLVRQPDLIYADEVFQTAFVDGYQLTNVPSVALISVISPVLGGTLVPRSVHALGRAQVHLLMTSRAMHGAYMSFVLPDDEVETAVRVLHTELQFDQMSTSDLSR